MDKLVGDGISWDKHVAEILKRRATDVVYYAPDKGNETWQRLAELAKTMKNPKLLDCGCHIGRFVDWLKGTGFDYTGVDQSAFALEIARKERPNDKWVHSLLWNLNYHEEFDIAFFNAVLQHNTHEEKRKILPKIFDAVKHGGYLYFSESTVLRDTATQLTREHWIRLAESVGFKFVASWHKNELGLDDSYLFRKD